VTLGPRETRELLRRHGLSPRQSRGQNFVVDPNTVRRIARLAGVGPDDHVVEIGAGLGALTRALLDTGARVTAIEVDEGLAGVLAEVVPDATVVVADARSVDWAPLLGDRPAVLVANLPYNVATPIVADLLDDVPLIHRMLVMVQAEVGARLAAGPGSKAYGAVSVKVAYWAHASVVGRVPPTVFLPQPKVDSALVAIERREVPAGPPAVAPAELFTLVRAGFGQRRKTLRRSLAGMVEEDDFAAADVDPGARAEQLDVDAWGRLALAVRTRSGGAP
jgi:16S rRNA (adenine1518-N6/adenine1519-N6)-dimethyltransferase